MIKKVVIIVFTVAIVAAVIFFLVSNGSANKDDGPKTIEVTRGTIVDKALAVGQIEPKREIAVKSKVGGIIRTVFVEVGDAVKIGDPLLDIKPDPTPVEFANAKREVELYQVAFDKVAREHKRAKQLMDKQLISTQEYETSLSDYEDAELRMKLAGEKLALIESGKATVADRTVDNIIKSEISGIVLSLLVENGDPVVPLTSFQAGTELMTLAQMDSLIFKGTVDEIDVGKLSEDMLAEIEIGALPNEKITGKVVRISPKAHKQEGATLFDVEIEIEDLGKSFLRAGYSANADVIITRKTDILLAPERLITTEDSLTSCEIMDSTGIITTREVTVGLSDGINIEIVDGLTEGELLVERPPKEITGD